MILIKKPWGKEELIEKNNKYMFKKLFMKKGHRCSMQFHKIKKETIFVLSGKLKVYYGKSSNKLKSKILNKNQFITIEPKIVHRMRALTSCYYLELSTPELNDVIRIADDYKRV